MRDSDLIRKLLKSGLTYRAISTIAKTSHGSVHQEKLAMKREEEQAQKKLLEVQAEEQKLQDEQKKVEDNIDSVLQTHQS